MKDSSSSRRDSSGYAERIREWLPRRMRALREAAGLTVYKLWRKCGVSQNTISEIESGKRMPGLHVLARLAWGVGVTLGEFFSGMEGGPKYS